MFMVLVKKFSSLLFLKKKKKLCKKEPYCIRAQPREPSGKLVSMDFSVRKFRGTAEMLPPSAASQY